MRTRRFDPRRVLPVFLVMAAFAVAVAIAVNASDSTSGTERSLLERALETHERSDQRDWAYTLTIVEDGKTRVARRDPARPPEQRWTLVSVDGVAPTKAEVVKFRAQRAEDSDEQESSGGEVREMISPGSAELVEETAGHAVFDFELAGEDEEDREFNQNLDATLRVAKNGDEPYVESIEMRAGEPFSAAPGVKIKEFSSVMTFAPVGPGKAVLPMTVEIRMLGRALLVKKIEQTVDVRYTDYRWVERAPAE